ncbi:MAG TPA: hypothetical protein VFB91_00960 [Terriglobales bacterium]|nr:hypothetical protein [Terriglobales bacterium]
MVISAVLVLLLPLAGAATVGKSLLAYLEFPPKTPELSHTPFSLPVFLGLALLILATTGPLLFRLIPFRQGYGPRKPVMPFPRWGWAGAGLGAASWILAWGRFPWMGGFQAHTFTPLWIAFILLVNAFTVRRTGRCLMLSRTRPFLLLFPVSAGFWWSFEYINRFVGNWRYVGVTEFGAVEYFLFATLPFSTVLPAVLSTRELLLSYPRLDGAFREWRPLSPGRPGAIGLAALLLSCAALFAVGIVPDFAFPLVWVAPPTLLISLAALRGEPHALSGIASGDWRPAVSSVLAALLCGFFWETWNFGSYAKWVYSIPYVDALHVFEMPLLGYAGYLPFGVLCAEIGDLIVGFDRED